MRLLRYFMTFYTYTLIRILQPPNDVDKKKKSILLNPCIHKEPEPQRGYLNLSNVSQLGSKEGDIRISPVSFFFNVYFWERERQSMSWGGAERERETESKAGSRLRAVTTELHTGLKLGNNEIMTGAKVGHSTNWATQVPLACLFLVRCSVQAP